jgi:beta-barrel assembly-enhancing protease
MHRVLILISLAAASANAQVNVYSPQQEGVLGAELAAQVRSQSALVDKVTVNRYVSRVGNKLAAVLPDRGRQYTFTVVDRNLGGSTNEPLALPGGYVFVPVNLLLAARSEDELSGMLAHAIAHIEARHGTRQATRAQAVNLTPAAVLFVSSPTAADSSLLPGPLLNLEQSFEKEADVIAVAIMARAGYDPEALASYVARLQYDTTASQSSALPSREERVAAIRASIQQRPQNEFSAMQEELHGLLRTPSPTPLIK